MSKGGEESSGGGPWLAPESERGVCHQSAEEAEIIDRVVPIVAASASSARPVSQLLGALSLSREVVEECPTTIHGRSISFADGLASLASGEEASPARSATGAASTSSSCSSKHYQQQQSWPGFANVCGSPALSCGVGDNWVEAIDRAIAEMVRREFPRREKLKTKGKRKEREVFFLTFSHLEKKKTKKKTKIQGDPATLPAALDRLSTDPYAPGDICESACWGDFVAVLPQMLLDDRMEVAGSAAALAAAVMD